MTHNSSSNISANVHLIHDLFSKISNIQVIFSYTEDPIVIFLCSPRARWASWTLIGFEVSNCSNIVILRSAITSPVPQPYQLITLVINSGENAQ